MTDTNRGLETKLIHSGEPRPRDRGAVSMPIYQSSTFEYDGETSYHDLKYIRLNNTPNHTVLHGKLAAIAGAEAALVAASGMAAISTTLLALLRHGDHLLVQDSLYGGTHDFVTQDLPELGIEFDFIDAARPETWAAKRRTTTRAIYVESITNPCLHVGDLGAVPTFAHEHGLVSVIDNTFTSPVNFRPCEHGYDLSLHSATKYLNGHSDLVAGCVMGHRDLVTRIRHKLNHLGGSLEPFGCFLLQRGLKTLALRVERQNENALELARFLEDHPAVNTVVYPGLASHPKHSRAAELFSGFGGMIAMELRGEVREADRFLQALELPVSAPSLGGVETLITRPCLTSHAGMAPADRAAVGISDELIRISVGIESIEDLKRDFGAALERAVSTQIA